MTDQATEQLTEEKINYLQNAVEDSSSAANDIWALQARRLASQNLSEAQIVQRKVEALIEGYQATQSKMIAFGMRAQTLYGRGDATASILFNKATELGELIGYYEGRLTQELPTLSALNAARTVLDGKVLFAEIGGATFDIGLAGLKLIEGDSSGAAASLGGAATAGVVTTLLVGTGLFSNPFSWAGLVIGGAFLSRGVEETIGEGIPIAQDFLGKFLDWIDPIGNLNELENAYSPGSGDWQRYFNPWSTLYNVEIPNQGSLDNSLLNVETDTLLATVAHFDEIIVQEAQGVNPDLVRTNCRRERQGARQ